MEAVAMKKMKKLTAYFKINLHIGNVNPKEKEEVVKP